MDQVLLQLAAAIRQWPTTDRDLCSRSSERIAQLLEDAAHVPALPATQAACMP